jgi:pilus assembly protein Flp/PilA
MTSFASRCTSTVRSFRRLLADQRGATAIEYGLIAALIGVAVMGTVFSMGRGINTTLYGAITNALASM